jgi:hypothetical protein
MSGYACQIPHLAIMRPTAAAATDLASDKPLLECFKQSDIIAGLLDNALGESVCDILAKPPPLSAADRAALVGYLNSLYDS